MSEFTAFHAEAFAARFLNLPEAIPEKLWTELTEKLHYDVDTPEALASDQYAARADGMRRLHTVGATTVIWKAALATCAAERWISRTSDTFLDDLLRDPLLDDLREILGGADSAAFRALSGLWTSAGFAAESPPPISVHTSHTSPQTRQR